VAKQQGGGCKSTVSKPTAELKGYPPSSAKDPAAPSPDGSKRTSNPAHISAVWFARHVLVLSLLPLPVPSKSLNA
jgi:hypothetical protein